MSNTNSKKTANGTYSTNSNVYLGYNIMAKRPKKMTVYQVRMNAPRPDRYIIVP